MQHPFIRQSFRLMFVIVIALLGFFSIKYFVALTYPFLFAFLLALIINPVVNIMTNKLKIPRALSVIVSILTLIALLIGGSAIMITETITGLTHLVAVVPENFETIMNYIFNFVYEKISPIYEQITDLYRRLDLAQQKTIADNLQSIGNSLIQTGKDILTSVLTFLTNILRSFPTLLTVLIFSTLGTFFISNDWYSIKGNVKKVFPAHILQSGRSVMEDLKKALGGFIRAQFTLIGMTFVIILIGLLILGVPYAFTIALILAFLDLLPIIGTVVVFIPWMVFELIFGTPSLGIGLGVLYIVTLVQRQLAEPKILSSNIGVNPLATLIALFVGYQLIGFAGLILGPTVLVLGKTLHEAGLFRYIKKFILEE
ncbi:MAG: sporulation integral membrane protein YtvI [Bacilli bacterium]